ncbi:hypothetical protein BT67DRAFT_451213 [Trichocladium antarcticum]|uniref:CUE domain-containing protein n=1 Tax=Trichocladium antarcticum TaxID=1450529 RepID=A0AAN6UFW3_9PEZI|nr:hypothetical protein BT67DRAFT_451213 [Trichocladium antarcticum]
MASTRLPAFALFPIAAWRDQLLPDEWVACLNAWLALVESHLSLSDADFLAISVKDVSLVAFLTSFIREVAVAGPGILGSSSSAKRLRKDCLLLVTRLLQCTSPPSGLAQWEFLADLSRVYGRKKAEGLLASLPGASREYLDSSLAGLKKFLIKNLDAGLDGGDLRGIEERLGRVNNLICISPAVAEFFLAGSDFLDGLISCYKITNPPLRKTLIATTYLCLVGLAEGQKVAVLADQLYSLKAAADAHKAGILNVNDSLVAELVTSTPLIQRLEHKIKESGAISSRTKSILSELGTFKKPGSTLPKPKRFIKRKIDKGKGLAAHDDAQAQQEIHIHLTSQISQVQDLFPELGAGFIAKLLNTYSSNTEEVITHLLDDSLPPSLATADRTEPLSHTTPQHPPRRRTSHLLPHPTPPRPLSPAENNNNNNNNHNLEERAQDDTIDLLTAATRNNLHLGKRHTTTLSHPSSEKAAILSALAAFDSDDDERDDTYDAADVGGTVDTTAAAAADADRAAQLPDGAEAALFRAWAAAGPFARDAATRRGAERARLRMETGLTDEAVEGWGVMMGRDGGMRRRLAARYGEWDGAQAQLGTTAWRAGAEDGEEGGAGGGPVARGGFRGRGMGGFGRGRGGAPPPAPDSELARRRKEANKGSRANHNRRDQRARKMARGGFPG